MTAPVVCTLNGLKPGKKAVESARAAGAGAPCARTRPPSPAAANADTAVTWRSRSRRFMEEDMGETLMQNRGIPDGKGERRPGKKPSKPASAPYIPGSSRCHFVAR